MKTHELSLAVVGLGFGANHARVLAGMEGVRLAAVCDTDEGRLAPWQGTAAYAEFETMLCEQRLDAVIVAVPAALHESFAAAAVRAGSAVLVEKPLAPSLAAGRRMAAVAAEAGLPLMAGHIERFNPALQELARRVRAGDIGRVLQMSARRTGAIRVPPADVNVVHDSAIHEIDAMRFVLGAEVEEVFAVAQRGVVTPLENGVAGVLRFAPAGDVAPLGSIEVNWLSPRRLRDLSVLGQEGLFVLDYAAQSLRYYKTPDVRSGPVQGWSLARSGENGEGIDIGVEPREQLALELEAFVAAVRNGSPMPVSTEDALAALAIADALTESARTGQPVRPERWSLVD